MSFQEICDREEKPEGTLQREAGLRKRRPVLTLVTHALSHRKGSTCLLFSGRVEGRTCVTGSVTTGSKASLPLKWEIKTVQI